ncbi:condensation protein [Billgrantia endophytica]|uniref:Condensation protein n=2 Tax=Billgrantia endophytica TaxID=2033802 RepID=A0A2N7TZK9_9GAMM|nr:condensation protein [Halomonas endophytica]
MPGQVRSGQIIGEREERMWFLQQQYPEMAHAHALVYRLLGRHSVERLREGLQEILKAPEYRVRYRFGDEGVLRRHDEMKVATPVLWRVQSSREAMEAILNLQETSWDLAEEAPLRCCLLLTPEATMLGLVAHRVLEAAVPTGWFQPFANFLQELETAPGGFDTGLVEMTDEEAEAAPRRDAETHHGTAAGDGDIRDLLLEAFRQALGAPEMMADDDFFDFGGHSLIATRIIGQLLNVHGIEVHLNDLFSYPTAAALAEHARRLLGSRQHEPSAPAAPDTPVPLALAQRSLWKVYEAFGFNEIFNIPFALRFLDPVNEPAFKRAFLDLLERHPGLRTLFVQRDGQVWQEVVPCNASSLYKWFWFSHETHLSELAVEASYRFDLARELPFRIRFMHDESSGQQVVSLLFHHIVLDEWSVNLMMEELEHAYRARVEGNVPSWQHQPPSFQAFALKQHAAGVSQAHLAYWTENLRDAPRGKPLPAPEASSVREEPSSSTGGWAEYKLAQDVSRGLYVLAKRNGASLFNVVYAAIAASIHYLGALDELVIGTSASGRNDADFFDTIGYFTTVVAHRIAFPPNLTLAGLITQVKGTINESMPYSDIPIDLVEEALNGGAEQGGDRMFEVFIQLHAKNKLNGAFRLQGGECIEFRQIDPEKSESLLGLQFEVLEEMIEGDESVRIMMSYRADHYGPEQVERIRLTVGETLARFARTPDDEVRLGRLEPRLVVS